MNLMDMATIGGKDAEEKRADLPTLDESEEINACSIKIDVDVDGVKEPWLLMFKNETHNHPTEIEPFGGAATCIGGAIRDPLSGRTYVYQAMRVTGAADPLVPVSETMPGKLPQRKLVTTAAAGYSSYGNQIGLATGLVDEMYHPGYAAKRLEIGAVVGAAPGEERAPGVPAPGRQDCPARRTHRARRLRRRDRLLQGPQAANPSKPAARRCRRAIRPTERKLQRLFRDGEVTRLIKRCNDFGAGGVSRGHRRAGRRPDDRPGQGAEEVRGSGRHGAGDFRDRRSGWRLCLRRRMWTRSSRRPTARTLRRPSWRR